MQAEVVERRRDLLRAIHEGDETRAAILRGELQKILRRALNRALDAGDAASVAEIRLQMSRDLAPVATFVGACASALILDVRRKHARELIDALGNGELDRLTARSEHFFVATESADGAVRINASLMDEGTVIGFYVQLLESHGGRVEVRHDLERSLVDRLEAAAASLLTRDARGTA